MGELTIINNNAFSFMSSKTNMVLDGSSLLIEPVLVVHEHWPQMSSVEDWPG